MKGFLIGIIFLISNAAVAAPILLTDDTGQLIGATGIFVEVGSFRQTFDVSFEDGSCANLYDGCDSRFDFSESPGNTGSEQALLGTLGSFLDTPELIRGCESTIQCNIFSPISDNTGSRFEVFAGPNNDDAFFGFVGITQFGDLTLDPGATFAVWSISAPSPVPCLLYTSPSPRDS